MATYLVDLENTGLAGLTGLDELSARDRVIVFYGTRTGSIAFDKHVELTKAKADVTYTKTERVAKNYLDFQLVTYLGYLIGSGQERVYYIISKDKGYDSCIEFWRKTDKQIAITRCESLQKQKPAAQQAAPREKAGTGKNAQENQQAAPRDKAGAGKSVQEKRPAAENGVQAADKGGQEEQENQASEASAAQNADHGGSLTGSQKKPGRKASGTRTSAQKTKQPEEQKTSGKQKLPECMRKKIRKAVREEALASGSYKLLYDYVVRSQDKHELNVALVKGFQQEKGNRLYKEILEVFVEYQKQKLSEAELPQS